MEVFEKEMNAIVKYLPSEMQPVAVVQAVSPASSPSPPASPIASSPARRRNNKPSVTTPSIPTAASVDKVSRQAVNLTLEIKGDHAKIKELETKMRASHRLAVRRHKKIVAMWRKAYATRATTAKKRQAQKKKIEAVERDARQQRAAYDAVVKKMQTELRATRRSLKKKTTSLDRLRMRLKTLAFAAALVAVPTGTVTLLRGTNIDALRRRMASVNVMKGIRTSSRTIGGRSSAPLGLPSTRKAAIAGNRALVAVPRTPNGFTPWVPPMDDAYTSTLVAVGGLAAVALGLSKLGTRLKKTARSYDRTEGSNEWTPVEEASSRVNNNRRGPGGPNGWTNEDAAWITRDLQRRQNRRREENRRAKIWNELHDRLRRERLSLRSR